MLQNEHNGASKHSTHYIGDFRDIKDVIVRAKWYKYVNITLQQHWKCCTQECHCKCYKPCRPCTWEHDVGAQHKRRYITCSYRWYKQEEMDIGFHGGIISQRLKRWIAIEDIITLHVVI